MEPELPGARKVMESHLQRGAPEAVRSGMLALADALPALRTHLVKDLNSRLDRVNAHVETRVFRLAEEIIRQSKDDLDQRHPNKTDREKLELLAVEVGKELERSVPETLDAMYPEYASEMTVLRREVEELYRSDPAKLTRAENIKRDMLYTIVRLVRRERAGAGVFSPQAAAPPEMPDLR